MQRIGLENTTRGVKEGDGNADEDLQVRQDGLLQLQR